MKNKKNWLIDFRNWKVRGVRRKKSYFLSLEWFDCCWYLWYIRRKRNESLGIYYREVHGYFNAYSLQDVERLNYPEEYYSFSNATPLFSYLTEEELDTCVRNNGEITLDEIDKISERIGKENDLTNVVYRYVR